jgi:catechol 2,3-dioxygenase-like lactoylglutathione lyase family enzyme
VRVPNLLRTSKFYQQFFGMKLAQQSDTIHILSVDGFVIQVNASKYTGHVGPVTNPQK